MALLCRRSGAWRWQCRGFRAWVVDASKGELKSRQAGQRRSSSNDTLYVHNTSAYLFKYKMNITFIYNFKQKLKSQII